MYLPKPRHMRTCSAEPQAMIGFAGRRVIEQTLQEQLPDDFQVKSITIRCDIRRRHRSGACFGHTVHVIEQTLLEQLPGSLPGSLVT